MTDVSFLTDKDFNEINKRSKVSIGDILFGMIGTIGNPVIVDRDDFAIKNVALIKEKTSNPITNKWLLQYLKSPSFNRFIQKENAGGTQKFIALGLIRDMKLRVPEFDEQQKIGAFFKKIDDTIALHQRKLAKLKELKQGYLQKMFPQNGSKFPQLRFSVLADAWEQRKLSDAVDNIGTGKSKYMLQEKSDLAKYEVLGSTSVIGYDEDYNHEGDLILTARVGANAGNLYHHSGKVKITDNTVFIQGKNLAFIYNLLTQFDLKKLSFGTGQPLVKASELKNLILYFPNNDEQAKIGSYFKQLDHLITLHQRKLEKLQELKKGYLQKMFC